MPKTHETFQVHWRFRANQSTMMDHVFIREDDSKQLHGKMKLAGLTGEVLIIKVKSVPEILGKVAASWRCGFNRWH